MRGPFASADGLLVSIGTYLSKLDVVVCYASGLSPFQNAHPADHISMGSHLMATAMGTTARGVGQAVEASVEPDMGVR